jgi:MFS family permease
VTTPSASRAAFAIAPGVLLAGVAGGIAFPILPIVGVQAGLSLPFIGVILAANRAMRVLSSPVVGTLTDRFGGRRTLIVGLVIQCAVMVLFTLGITTHAPGIFFLAGRVLHGPGSACVFVAGQALALHAGGAKHAGGSSAIVRAAMSLGIPVGLVTGGLLSDRFGDARTFEIAFLGVVAATIAAFAMVPDLRVQVPKRSPFPELFKAMRTGSLFSLGALNFAVSFSAQGMVLTTLSLLVHARGMSVAHMGEKGTASFFMGLMVVTSALVMVVAGRLGDRFAAHGRLAFVGLVLLIPSLLIIALVPTSTGVVVGMIAIGVAGGALSPALLTLVGKTLPPHQRGTGVGVLQLFGDIGGTLGPLVGTVLLRDSLRAPYLVAAALVTCLVPFAVRLAARGRSG